MKMFYINKRRRKQWQSLGVIGLFTITVLTLIVIISRLDEYHQRDNPSDNHHNYNSDDTLSSSSPIWTRISDTVHVYSAHFDPRIQHGPQLSLKITNTFSSSRFIQNDAKISFNLIRIIGIKRFPSPASIRARHPLAWLRIKEETHFHENYECQLFLPQGASYVKITSTILTYHVIEEGIKAFATCFFNCYFNQTKEISSPYPLFVSLSPKNVSEYPDKLLKVERNFPKKNSDKLNTSSSSYLAVCVRPLFSTHNQDIALRGRLIQFISYYVVMGVTTFNFYEFSIFPQVRNYLSKISGLFRQLNSFAKPNFRLSLSIRRHVWNLPTGNTSELWDFGSLAALNDCLYRNMGADHVLFLDLDEFIVPQNKETSGLRELIKYLEKVGVGESTDGESKPAQIGFRNTFFCSEFCRQGQNASNNYDIGNFPISTCATRTKRVWPEKLRSKFIVRPSQIISVGHHTSHNFWRKIVAKSPQIDAKQGHNPLSITASPGVALLNHYRDCGPISTRKHPIFNRLTVKDESILRILKNKRFVWFLS